MLSIKNVTSSAESSKYFTKDNYYTQDDFRASYIGKGAAALHLKEPVTEERFKELLDGKLTEEIQLYSSRGHRAGIDLTFSAPKSVSIAAFATSDDNKKNIMAAHRKAIEKTIQYMEEHTLNARVTKEKKTDTIRTDNLVAVTFEHDTSRELDPQLHTHCVIINATQDSEGKWRALTNEEIYKQKMLLGALYRSELAKELQQKGYAVEKGDKGTFELAGITKEQIDYFSTRRQQIESYMHTHGMTTAAEAAEATLKTRRTKIALEDRSELHGYWKEQAASLKLALSKQPVEQTNPHYSAEKSVDFAIEKLSERQSVFTHKQLFITAFQEAVGSSDLGSVEKAIQEALAEKKLYRRGENYTTAAAVTREKEIVKLMQEGKKTVDCIANPEAIATGFETFRQEKGFDLSPGQKASSSLILSGTDRVIGIEGYAGTGKTTMLEYVKQIAETEGYTIKGYCPSSAAAKVLETETGIESTTLASHLIRTKTERAPAEKEIWVIDEASMVSSVQAHELLTAADKSGARVVMLGDRKQLSSVEAGKPFAMLIDKGMNFEKITEIRRQELSGKAIEKLRKAGVPEEEISRMKEHAATLKSAVYDAIEGKIPEALSKIDLRQEADSTKRLQTIIDTFKKYSPEKQAATLIITSTNEEKRQLNTALRQHHQETGTIAGEEKTVQALFGRNLEKVEMKKAYNYRPGDVIRFGKTYKSLGVEKGEYATLEGYDPRIGLVVATTGTQAIYFDPAKIANLELFAPEERRLAVGDQLRFTKNDKELNTRNGERATVTALTDTTATLRIGTEERQFKLSDLRHIEYAYATTVHSSQGMTFDNVIANIDTKNKNLLGLEPFYVTISRERHTIELYTDNTEALPDILKKSVAQKSALEEYEAHRADQVSQWLKTFKHSTIPQLSEIDPEAAARVTPEPPAPAPASSPAAERPREAIPAQPQQQPEKATPAQQAPAKEAPAKHATPHQSPTAALNTLATQARHADDHLYIPPVMQLVLQSLPNNTYYSATHPEQAAQAQPLNLPDGTAAAELPNGSILVKTSEGTYTETAPDNTRYFRMQDGSLGNIKPDGSINRYTETENRWETIGKTNPPEPAKERRQADKDR